MVREPNFLQERAGGTSGHLSSSINGSLGAERALIARQGGQIQARGHVVGLRRHDVIHAPGTRSLPAGQA